MSTQFETFLNFGFWKELDKAKKLNCNAIIVCGIFTSDTFLVQYRQTFFLLGHFPDIRY